MITIKEILDVLIMTGFLGYLFMDFVRTRDTSIVDMIDRGVSIDNVKHKVWWNDFLYSSAVLAPAVILHEMAHKFVAIYFGLDATFMAFYADPFTLMLGIVAVLMKVFNTGFFFIVPGFVQISGGVTPFEMLLIAVAGPVVHGLFWLGSLYALKKTRLTNQQAHFLILVKKINGLLFIFNLLPIPGFDGSKALSAIQQLV
mgnify:CR=1 FL=1